MSSATFTLYSQIFVWCTACHFIFLFLSIVNFPLGAFRCSDGGDVVGEEP